MSFVSGPTGGDVSDVECRAALNSLIGELRLNGLMA